MTPLPKTIEELYCAAHNATRDQFRRRAFRRCLHRRATPLVHFLQAFDRGYFAPDRELIASMAQAKTMAQVQEELHDYFLDAQNRRWLRRHAKVRVSSRRVLRFANECLSLAKDQPVTGQTAIPGAAPSGSDRRKARKLSFAHHSVAS